MPRASDHRASRRTAAGVAPAHVGCSGWNYRSWRDDFYPHGTPAREWLASYAQRFDTVEVNTTFYRLIARAAVERWVEQTPPGFLFAVKASRYLTHIKRLSQIGEGVARFYERIEPLIEADRLTAVLWQLPANFHRDDARLAGALSQLPPGRHAFEFRHPSWFCPETMALLREHDVALVIGDHPERGFQTEEATAGWRYVRFHYGHRGRRGNYSDREIDEWAVRLHRLRADGELLAYFNNDWEGFAPRNAQRLRRRLSELERQPTGTRAGARTRSAAA